MRETREALEKAVARLGRTEWYVNLHYFRFLKVLTWVSERIPKGASGLEIGVWPGYLGVALGNIGYAVTGTDLEPDRMKDIGIQIMKTDLNLEPLPFENATLDFIVCSEVIEHVHKQKTIDALREMLRVVKPGGYVFITTPNALRPGRAISAGTTVDAHGHGHDREYSYPEIARLAREAGCVIEQGKTISFYAGVGKSGEHKYFFPLAYFFQYPNKKRNILKLIAYPFLKFVPLMRDSIYIIIKKPHA